MGSTSKGLVPDDVIQRITAEEMVRFEVQGRLRDQEEDRSRAKLMKFLNSGFGLFLLSTILVTGLGGVLSWWNQRSTEQRTQKELEKKLLAEYQWRLIEVDARISDITAATNPDIKQGDTIYIYRAAMGAPEFHAALPEFQNEHWAGLIIQISDELYDLGASDEATAQAITAARELTSSNYVSDQGKNYLPVEYLEPRSKILHTYLDSARKQILR